MADLNKTIEKFLDTPDTTSSFSKEDIVGNRLMSVLAYLSWLVLIPLFICRASDYTRYHVNQGFILAIVETVGGAVLGALAGIPVIGLLFGIVGTVFGIACFLYAVIGILNVLNGKAKELPYIGRVRIIK